ncbi:MAG: RlmE family RNA methyltransferase [Alphaproteobacteria bacterium]|nr:RlmE family RNA methyltransferase [Alphaproteobacteria bacterium]
MTPPRGPRAAPPGGRAKRTELKTGRGRTVSSKRWLERQLNDPYVQAARAQGYRSRAAYKLVELDAELKLLRRGVRIVDLGAAPGGWTQVAVERGAQVVAVDILVMDPVPGARVLTLDFLDEGSPAAVREALGGPVDIVLSDMAAPATGHRQTDHLRIVALCEAAAAFAVEVLAPGGTFLCKVLQGGTEASLLADLKRRFRAVRHVKPAASRKDSAEVYLVATGFREAPPTASDR